MTKRQRWTVVRERGHSGASLALRVGKSKHTVCRYLNGEQFTHETAAKIADVLGLAVADLWPKHSLRPVAA